MQPDRTAHCRAIGALGGRATVERYGREHMAAIGRLGFEAAMRSVGGHVVAQKLGASYEQKFGRPIQRRIDSDEYKEKCRLWAEARRLYPNLECVECGAPHADRHHPDGVLAGNAPGRVEGRCQDHHQEWHRQRYREKRTAS